MTNKKETAQEVSVQEQLDKIFVVNILINERSYYLLDLNLSISKNISDSLIIPSEDFAYKMATITENFYKGSVGKVKKVSLEEMFY
jgi:hypothetical protein